MNALPHRSLRGRPRAVALALTAAGVLAAGLGLLAGLPKSPSQLVPGVDSTDGPAQRGESSSSGSSTAARAGRSPEVVPSTTGNVAGGGGPRLLLLSEATLHPIAGARVRAWESRPGPVFEAVADDEGRCSLPDSGRWTVSAEADDHVRKLCELEAAEQEIVLLLEPSGELEVLVLDERGAPVPGLTLRLLPPIAEGEEWGRAWRGVALQSVAFDPDHHAAIPSLEPDPSVGGRAGTDPTEGLPDVRLRNRRIDGSHYAALDARATTRTSDERGIVRWSGLPLADGYRVGAYSEARVLLDPPNEATPYFSRDGMLVAGDPVSRDLSGRVAVRGDEPARVLVRVFPGTGVMGHFPTARPLPSTRVVVVLSHRTEYRFDDAPGLIEYFGERAGRTDAATSSFLFEGVEPGRKSIRAWWQEQGNVFRFACKELDLAPGEIRDLGGIHESTGVDQEVILRFQDPEGRPLSEIDVLAEPDANRLVLSIDTVSDSDQACSDLSILLTVPTGEPLLLRGVPAGKAYLQADLGPGTSPFASDDLRFLGPQTRRFELPTGRPLVLPIVVERAGHLDLIATCPTESGPSRVRGYLRSEDDGSIVRVSLDAEPGVPGRLRGTTRARGAHHRLFLHGAGDDSDAVGAGLWLDAPIEIGPEREVEVDLRVGASVRGRAFDREGRPLAGERLQFSPADWAAPDSDLWLYHVQTDERGDFSLRGLPPGATVVSRRYPKSPLIVGEAGSETSVVLRP